MKKLFFIVLGAAFCLQAMAQQEQPTGNITADSLSLVNNNFERTSSKPPKIDLSNRANDHFMLQYGFDNWGSVPDSINTSGFSRHFNLYIMLDKPFKTSPHLSVGVGIGVGSSNIFFADTYVDIKANTATLPFTNVSSSATNHFDKFKVTTTFAEIPLELRYSSNPAQPDKGAKIAIGLKGGLLLSAHTKGKNLLDANGGSIYGTKYIRKEYDKAYFNTSRFAATARIGFGHVSVDGSYQLTGVLKEGAGPVIKPYSIGITLSGL